MLPSKSTRVAIRRLLDGLPTAEIGAIYCDEGGDAFWRARRPAVERVGVRWSQEWARRVPRGGHSVYVGAGVAELPVLLTEVLDLDRRCSAFNLRPAECALLDDALRSAGLGDRLRIQPACPVRTGALEPGFDGLAMVSVLTDPETYPELSDVTYGRAMALELDVSAFAAQRDAARALVAGLLGSAALPAVVATTVDEVPWIMEAAAGLGLAVDADDTVLETPLVGDPAGFLALRRAAQP